MNKNESGITLPEIFIVIIILAIIGAIVMPKISMARSNARADKIIDDLEMLRCQISLYTIQHDGLLPGQKTVGGDIKEQDFIAALTIKGKQGIGPYIKEIPFNPFNRLNSVMFNSEDLPEACGFGWFVNTQTGEIRPDDCREHLVY
jgi:type II secretory pathway pseudopilin PulG